MRAHHGGPGLWTWPADLNVTLRKRLQVIAFLVVVQEEIAPIRERRRRSRPQVPAPARWIAPGAGGVNVPNKHDVLGPCGCASSIFIHELLFVIH